MASDLDIANRALSRLGAARINSTGDDTKNARAVASALATVRDEVLVDHPWNCAVKRAVVYATTGTVTGVTLTGTRVRILFASHPFRVNDPISITGIVGTSQANGDWIAGNITATSLDLIDPATGAFKDDDGFSAWVSGGVVTRRGLWQHDVSYTLPSDLLRVLEVEDQRDSDWLVEDGRLLTDLGPPLNIRYVYRNTNTATYPPLLVSALAARLAAELALEIVDSPAKSQLARDAYDRILFQAKSADGREQTPTVIAEGSWVTARLST